MLIAARVTTHISQKFKRGAGYLFFESSAEKTGKTDTTVKPHTEQTAMLARGVTGKTVDNSNLLTTRG